MANSPEIEVIFDRDEYERATEQLRLVESTLPRDSVSVLAREVVTRLAFRAHKLREQNYGPTDAEIDTLCAALLSSDEDAGERIILAVRRDGTDVTQIYLGYVVGAARRLGEMWDDDTASFVDITLASGRLYRIIRGLRHVLASGITEGREDRPAFFALVPGENHTLGIEIATDLFRREGWDIDLALDMSHEELVMHSEKRNYQAIVLVANSDEMLGALTRLIIALRVTQPLAHIVVAGKILNQFSNIGEMTGVDAVIDRLETAVATVRDMLAKG